MSGVIQISDILEEVNSLHVRGLDNGDNPGWPKFGSYYRVKRGMMTIITGIPASGKSEFADAMFVNLAMEQGWKFALFSPENYPISLHAVKIIEKYTGKAFKHPYFPERSITRGEIGDAVEFIGEHFTWIYPDDSKEAVTLDVILAKALTIKEMGGLDGLLIDPWNEIETQRGNMSETDYISESLTKIRRWARRHNVHVWIVAHPMKLQKNKAGTYDPPTPYEISGSAHWRNKADFCICVHRENLTDTLVLVIVQKVKFKHLGRVGSVDFRYDTYSGRYTETE